MFFSYSIIDIDNRVVSFMRTDQAIIRLSIAQAIPLSSIVTDLFGSLLEGNYIRAQLVSIREAFGNGYGRMPDWLTWRPASDWTWPRRGREGGSRWSGRAPSACSWPSPAAPSAWRRTAPPSAPRPTSCTSPGATPEAELAVAVAVAEAAPPPPWPSRDWPLSRRTPYAARRTN